MQKKHILKAFSILTAVCVTAGCNGSTTAEITTVTEQSIVTTEDVGETNGIKYCEIPEGMTFEDLCGLFYYKDTQLKFPCTLDEILALDEEFIAGEYEEARRFTCIYKYDDNGVILDFIGMSTNGDLNSYEDISNRFIFNVGSGSTEYSFYQDVLSFNGVHRGADFSAVKELLGEPSYEENRCCGYYFRQDNKSISLEFSYTENYKFEYACFGYEKGNV